MIDLDRLYRQERGRVLASLIRLLGGFDLAEEALAEAFLAAAQQWPQSGVPANPRAWLVSAGRFKIIDRLRRRSRFKALSPELQRQIEGEEPPMPEDRETIADDTLRLIFTCCHPALPGDTQVAMTLREVCGLTTEEIATAFLAKPATIAQRIVRAKTRIRDANLPYQVPEPAEWAERLDAVLHTIYLIFNEGYEASHGEALLRRELSQEAIRLARLLVTLHPDAEAEGLLALLLLHEARAAARTDAAGDLVLLPDQDRTLWNTDLIAEGIAHARAALARPPVGVYTLQALIASEHMRAATAAATDWNAISDLYDLLATADRSPVVALNRAVAIAMRDGPEAGLDLIAPLIASPLATYRFAHAAKADLLRRAGRWSEARDAYQAALALTEQTAERRYLEKRLREMAD